MSEDRPRAPATEDRPRRARPDQEHGRPADRPQGRPRQAEGEKEAEGEKGPGRLDARGAVRRALEEFTALTHDTVEGVVGVERDGDGWKVTFEVLEDAHIPSTSDILAEYQVRLSTDGELLTYNRGRRYVRGRVEP